MAVSEYTRHCLQVRVSHLDVSKLQKLLRVVQPPVVGLHTEDTHVPSHQPLEHRQHLPRNSDVCLMVIVVFNLRMACRLLSKVMG